MGKKVCDFDKLLLGLHGFAEVVSVEFHEVGGDSLFTGESSKVAVVFPMCTFMQPEQHVWIC